VASQKLIVVSFEIERPNDIYPTSFRPEWRLLFFRRVCATRSHGAEESLIGFGHVGARSKWALAPEANAPLASDAQH
jgi:hypothetical protein